MALNDESAESGGLPKDAMVGKYMNELVRMGYVKESATLKAIDSGEEENFVQDLGDGNKIFITGKPFYRNGEIEFVVCTERDITESERLRELLHAQKEENEKYETELEYLRNQNPSMSEEIIFENASMREIVETALKIARLDATVLLTGESGTGKEVFANLIYKNSTRRDGPFITVNCAAIPESLMESEFFGYEKGAFTGADKSGKVGLFEPTHKGTLFLDEIGDLPIHMQSKLLRALQERKIIRVGGGKNISVDIRIITATNVDLKKAIELGQFREDLFYRLNVVPIEIPPLRSWPGDIVKLAEYFVEKLSRQYKVTKKLSEDAADTLKDYGWPGNIRELKNCIERIVVSFSGCSITKFQVNKVLNKDIPLGNSFAVDENATYKELMETYEKELLLSMMKKYGKAYLVSRHLKINKSTLCRRLQKYNILIHAHEEPYSMPTTFADKGPKYCDFKYYVNKQVAPLVALGFGKVKEVDISGTKVNPLDALLRLVPNPGDAFLSDDPSTFEYKDRTKHVSIMLELIDAESGQPRTYTIYIPDMNKPRDKIYELFATQVNVALPAVIGMKMTVEGTKKGTIFSEELNPERFIELIQATGYPNRWVETAK